jgi:DNA-binding response OmpR family regulator
MSGNRVLVMISTIDLRAVSIKVLLIEGDEFVGAALVGNLERSGMQAALAGTAANGLASKRTFSPDIILVDRNLLDMDGISLLKILVDQGDCGIIVLSAADDENDRIVALEMGADDYVTKPPHSRELQARIRAVFRRLTVRSAIKHEPSLAVIHLGKLQVDLANRVVRSENGNPIALTNAEFVVMATLIAADGEAVSRDRLSAAALRRPWRAEDRGVDQLVLNLRQKLASAGGRHLVHSIRSAGYLLAAALAPEDPVKPSLDPLPARDAVEEISAASPGGSFPSSFI